MAIEVNEDTRQLRVLDESIFYDGDTRPGLSHTTGYTLSLDDESYILCFTGRRGGGKTTAMTYYAAKCMWLYNMRVLSNYPLEFVLHRENGSSYVCRAEPLDLYKLLCFDNDYKNCLICIDEAPDIISHLAATTWKNRLLNIFVRELRKNNNSLMLCAQDFALIDKSLRWQVDVLVECEDASKRYPGSHLVKGSVILLRFLDNSGMWTGKTWQDKEYINKLYHKYEEVGYKASLRSSILWGDDEHKAVFDTRYMQDIWESLRRVDMHMSTYNVGDKAGDSADKFPVSSKVLYSAFEEISGILGNAPDSRPAVYQRDFMRNLGALSDADKNNLGRKLSDFNVARGGEGSKRFYDFKDFDIDSFRVYVQNTASKREVSSEVKAE